MNSRERYVESLTFGKPDRITFAPGWPRESTIRRWHSEGLPEGEDHTKAIIRILGLDPACVHRMSDPGVAFKMIPEFEEKVISHENGHYIVRDWMGAITEISDEFDYTYIRSARDFVTRKWHKFPVENRDDWNEMKKRFNADSEGRFPKDFETRCEKIRNGEYPVSISFNGPFWQMREWCGFENLCIFMVEDPDFIMEMSDFWKDFVSQMLDKALQHIVPDRVLISEDMAYKAHSMISPEMTRRYLAPCYAEWVPMLKRKGVRIIDMDSDGCVDELIPIWIEYGFNSCTPVEVAAGNDIVAFRRLYGKKMAYQGGIDKRCIAAGGKILRDEMERVIPPLLVDGGFIPGCDHGVPHDISWSNFIEYCRILAEMTGWLKR